jgi:hypothetical protein
MLINMVVYNVEIHNKSSESTSFAIFAAPPEVAQGHILSRESKSEPHSKSGPKPNVCAWTVRTLPPNGNGLMSVNMENYACEVHNSRICLLTDRSNKGVCKDLGDRKDRDAGLVTVLPPRECLLHELPIEGTIKKPNGCMSLCLSPEINLIGFIAVVALRSRADSPVLGLESMPNINIKPGSFAINCDSSFGSADQILIGIGKRGNIRTDLVIPVAVVSFQLESV